MRHTLLRDYETRSECDLGKCGSYVYAMHPTTAVTVCGYSVDDGPVQQWFPGDPVPPEFIEAATNPNWLCVAHNCEFELAIETYIMGPKHGWPMIPVERNRDTMAAACAAALPAALKEVGQVLGLKHQKGDDAPMLRMCKPRRGRKGEEEDVTYYHEDEEDYEDLYDYNRGDIESERELDGRLPPLSDQEQRVWQAHLAINQRGLPIDTELVSAAWTTMRTLGPTVDAAVMEHTRGEVEKATSVPAMKKWLAARDHEFKSLNKTVIEDTLAREDLAHDVRQLLELRKAGNSASAKKLSALERCCPDGRVRGLFRFHGASTGRFTSMGLQVQNLKNADVSEELLADILVLDYRQLASKYPDKPVMALLGDLGRSMIKASPGMKFIGGDFSSVESRTLAWVANEAWKLDQYRRFDATKDQRDEVYYTLGCRMLGKEIGIPTGKKDPIRVIGKFSDLANGYGGTHNAIERIARGQFTEDQRRQMSQQWRTQHPATVRYWYTLERVTRQAFHNPQKVIECPPLRVRYVPDTLHIKLPSGRKLSYPFPRVMTDDYGKQVIGFMGIKSSGKSRKWKEQRSWFGSWIENAIQAISRDLLVEAILRLEQHGYRVVAHIHDEILAEVPEDFGSEDEFKRIMTASPSWALTLPIAAETWTGKRFK